MCFRMRQGDRGEFTFDDIAEHVDDAIAELPEKERCVVVAHFLEGRTHEAIAEEFGVGRSTVSYRVGKGVERIRTKLAAKGITASATGLGAVLASAPVEAAPAGLVAAVGKLAVAGTAGTATGVAAVATGGAFAFWKVAAVASVVVVAAGGGILIAQTPTDDPVASAQTTETSEQEAPQTNPQEESQVAASVSDAASGEPPDSINGTVVSTLGFPRPDVYLSNDWPWNIYRGESADDQGRFSLPIPQDGPESWMAYSQNTDTAALFAVGSDPPGDTIQIALNMRLMSVDGRVVTREGEGVKKARVQIRLTSPEGVEHLAAPLGSDGEGYIVSGKFPAADGWMLDARVVPTRAGSARRLAGERRRCSMTFWRSRCLTWSCRTRPRRISMRTEPWMLVRPAAMRPSLSDCTAVASKTRMESRSKAFNSN